jgi:hypothetical protein
MTGRAIDEGTKHFRHPHPASGRGHPLEPRRFSASGTSFQPDVRTQTRIETEFKVVNVAESNPRLRR